MPENPIDKRLPVKYEPQLALHICEEIASGKTVLEISEMEGMPRRSTIYKWLAVYPKFFDAYERAREVSAQSLEEEAIALARKLTGPHDFTNVRVMAYNYAMQQLRWSAARRDKMRYGQQQQTGPTAVPIQITTTLNLGQDGIAPTDSKTGVYTVEATVQLGPTETTGYEEDTVEHVDVEGEVLDLEPEGGENEQRAFGLPETETQQLHNPRPGRPTRRKKGHKSPAATALTARRYAQKEIRAAQQKKKDVE